MKIWRELLHEGFLDDESKDFLKGILRFIGAKVGGNKGELVKRLKEFVAYENSVEEKSKDDENTGLPQPSKVPELGDIDVKVEIKANGNGKTKIKTNGKVKAKTVKAKREPVKTEPSTSTRPRRAGSHRSYNDNDDNMHLDDF